MARSCAVSGIATMDMDAVAELFILTKGIANVIHLSRERIMEGPLAEMMKRQRYPADADIRLPLRIASRFEAIQHMLLTYGLDQDALENCQSALIQLEGTYKNIVYYSSGPNSHGRIASERCHSIAMPRPANRAGQGASASSSAIRNSRCGVTGSAMRTRSSEAT